MKRNFTLWTANYWGFTPGDGLPIRTSHSRPYKPLSYKLEYKLPELFPASDLMKNYSAMGVQGFRERYWQDLDRLGADRLTAIFNELVRVSGETNLVLMCFEKSPNDCHRGDFAIWWRNNTGDTVKEVPRKR